MTGHIRVPDDTAGNRIHGFHSLVWASVRVGDYTTEWIPGPMGVYEDSTLRSRRET
jgi:hypothetical protein